MGFEFKRKNRGKKEEKERKKKEEKKQFVRGRSESRRHLKRWTCEGREDKKNLNL